MVGESLNFDPPASALSSTVARGATFTGAAQIIKLGCQIASVVVLSRLLEPRDFGIIAMVAPVMAFVGLFQDMGLTQATVQRPQLTHALVNSLFWINLALGTMLAIAMLIVSPLIGKFYGEPDVGPLAAAMGLQIFVMAAGAQHHAIITRKMQMGKLALLESSGAVVGLLAAISWAYLEPTYWALFLASLVTISWSVVGSWIISGWRPSLPRVTPGSREMVTFGAGITGFNFANFFSRNLDLILIGQRWGGQQLGFYDRANKLLLFPLQQIIYPLGRVMVPALSRLCDEPDRYRHAYLRVAPLLLIAALPGVAVAIGMADQLIPLALGPQWGGTVTVFQALGFAGMLQPLNSPAGWLFISQGRSMDFMRWGIFGAITTGAAFWIGLPYGAAGVALAYAIHEYARTPLLWLYVGRRGPVRAWDVARATFPVIMGAHCALGAVWTLRAAFPTEPVIALLFATLTSYAVSLMVAMLFPAGRAPVRELADMARKLVKGYAH